MNIARSADFAHDDTGIRTVVVFTGTLAAEGTVAAEKPSSNSLSVSRAEAGGGVVQRVTGFRRSTEGASIMETVVRGKILIFSEKSGINT